MDSSHFSLFTFHNAVSHLHRHDFASSSLPNGVNAPSRLLRAVSEKKWVPFLTSPRPRITTPVQNHRIFAIIEAYTGSLSCRFLTWVSNNWWFSSAHGGSSLWHRPGMLLPLLLWAASCCPHEHSTMCVLESPQLPIWHCMSPYFSWWCKAIFSLPHREHISQRLVQSLPKVFAGSFHTYILRGLYLWYLPLLNHPYSFFSRLHATWSPRSHFIYLLCCRQYIHNNVHRKYLLTNGLQQPNYSNKDN